jgi:hypothetical protein
MGHSSLRDSHSVKKVAFSRFYSVAEEACEHDKEECGGGGAWAAGWIEGREGARGEDDGGGAERERQESGAGALGQVEEKSKKDLSIRERSRMIGS